MFFGLSMAAIAATAVMVVTAAIAVMVISDIMTAVTMRSSFAVNGFYDRYGGTSQTHSSSH